MAVISRHAPAAIDAQAVALGRESTVTRLRRVLGRYRPTEAKAEEARRVSFSSTPQGWRLPALLPHDEGAVVEKSLRERRVELFRSGEAPVDWADALMALVERSDAGVAVERPHKDRHLVLLHLPVGADGHLHLGQGLSPGLARCQAGQRGPGLPHRARPGPGSSSRTATGGAGSRVVTAAAGSRSTTSPTGRTGADRHLEPAVPVLHAPPPHHRGGLGIEGDADDPAGVTFTDERGRRLDNRGHPVLPTTAPPPGHWKPPIYFDERIPVPA